MKKTVTDFDFQKALEMVQNGQSLLVKEGILNPLIKQLTELHLREKSISILLKILQRIDAMVKAKRRSNRSTGILNYPRPEIESRLFLLKTNYTKNIQ